MIKTIEDLKNISSFNKEYFSEANKIFFNDIDYQILESKTKEKYLITQTFKFSDMFDGIQKACYVIKPISINGEIGSLIDLEFKTLKEVKKYLKREKI